MIVDVDADAGEQIAHRFGARFVAADLSTIDGVRAMLTAARAELGGWTCWSTMPAGWSSRSTRRERRTLDAHAGSQPGGVMLSTQLALDLMGPGGAIVNMGSTPGSATARTAR